MIIHTGLDVVKGTDWYSVQKKLQVQLFPNAQLTHWCFHGNEVSIVFHLVHQMGGSGWKENKLLHVY